MTLKGGQPFFDRYRKLRGAVDCGRTSGCRTCGLLLFTTDGELANRPDATLSREVEREYAVRVFGQVDESKLRDLSRGVQLEDARGHLRPILNSAAAKALTSGIT